MFNWFRQAIQSIIYISEHTACEYSLNELGLLAYIYLINGVLEPSKVLVFSSITPFSTIIKKLYIISL